MIMEEVLNFLLETLTNVSLCRKEEFKELVIFNFIAIEEIMRYNLNSSGFHIFEMYIWNGRLMTWAEHVFMRDFSLKYNLKYSPNFLRHLGYSIQLDNGNTLLTLFTSKNETKINFNNKFYVLENLEIFNDSILYTSRTMYLTNWDFATRFIISNNYNAIPNQIRIHNSISKIGLDCFNAFLHSLEKCKEDLIFLKINSEGRIEISEILLNLNEINKNIENYNSKTHIDTCSIYFEKSYQYNPIKNKNMISMRKL